jgi:hypothetical protein
MKIKWDIFIIFQNRLGFSLKCTKLIKRIDIIMKRYPGCQSDIICDDDEAIVHAFRSSLRARFQPVGFQAGGKDEP